MKKIEGKNKSGKSYKKLGFYLIGLAICLMAIIALVKFGTILFLLPIWSWISHTIVNATGVDIWLAKALSALLILPLIYVASLVFSLKKKKRKIGIALLSATTVIICLGMFFITKDTYFSFKSGEATKWYIITPQGEYKFSSSHGFDPIWGEEYKVVTPQVVEDYIRQQQNEVYSALPQDQYFDIKTGKAVKWYAVLPDSSITIYTHSGVDPKYGIELKPVTREVVKKIEKIKKNKNNVKISKPYPKKLEHKKQKIKKETIMLIIKRSSTGIGFIFLIFALSTPILYWPFILFVKDKKKGIKIVMYILMTLIIFHILMTIISVAYNLSG